MSDQAVKVANLSDVQGIREPFVIKKEARTVGDALAIIDGVASHKIAVLVQYAPGYYTHFKLDKTYALRRLRDMRRDAPIICDLDRDGYCWIGART